MPQNGTNRSSDIYDFLKNRFDLSNITDKDGNPTMDPTQMEMFTFSFVTSEGNSLGTIVISLLDDNDSSDSLKIYYGQDVAEAIGSDSKEFYQFLNDLRMFSKAHMLGFDVRDINRTRLTKQDILPPISEDLLETFVPREGRIELTNYTDNAGRDCIGVWYHYPPPSKSSTGLGRVVYQDGSWFAKGDDVTIGEYNTREQAIRAVCIRNGIREKNPVIESSFGPIDGTVKTSVQPLDNLRLIIKHSDRVNPEQRGARSRRIHRLYLANSQGERFLLPFKSLRAGRAMMRHVNEGGTPYDKIGARIAEMVDEMASLSRFMRKTRHLSEAGDDQELTEVLTSCKERQDEIKGMLSSLGTQRGYLKHKQTFENDQNGLDEDNSLDEALKRWQVDESLSDCVPYVARSYNNYRMKKQPTHEFGEFKKWIEEPQINEDENGKRFFVVPSEDWPDGFFDVCDRLNGNKPVTKTPFSDQDPAEEFADEMNNGDDYPAGWDVDMR